jgi:AcrR family transcriptional regulator
MELTTRQKSENTRSRIIEAAYQLFLVQGFHATTMRQIVQKAGVTMGGIYAHFSSKNDIWQAVFMERHPFQAILPIVQASQGETMDEVIQDAARRLVSELGQHSDFFNLMFIELVEFNGANFPALFKQLIPEVLKLPTLFAGKNGSFRDIPYPTLARAFFGLFASYFITEQMIPANVRQMMGANALDQFVDLYLHGALED